MADAGEGEGCPEIHDDGGPARLAPGREGVGDEVRADLVGARYREGKPPVYPGPEDDGERSRKAART